MELFNPFEDVSKAATWPPQGATVLRVLVPTGNNIGHGLDLKHVRARTKGPRRPALERYGRKSIKGVSKAYNPFAPNSTKVALRQISEMRAPSKPPANRQAASLGPRLRDAKEKRRQSNLIWGSSGTGSTNRRRIR